MENEDNVIELKNITQSFDDKTVLTDLSVNFIKGKVTALLGKSGSGKSTLLQIINGMIKPQKAKLKF
jgi:ABC-type Fe3+/spermidine/putrescine transport system ATPase subunit